MRFFRPVEITVGVGPVDGSRPRLQRGRKRLASRRHRPCLEALEDRTLPSVSLVGSVFTLAAPHVAIVGATVFADVNHDNTVDQSFNYASAAGPTTLRAGSGPLYSGMAQTGPLFVTGLDSAFSKLTVHLSVSISASAGTGITTIALLSPLGFEQGIRADLLTVDQSGSADISLSGATIDNNENGGPYNRRSPITSSQANILGAPELPFSSSTDTGIAPGLPNGNWYLLVYRDDGRAPAGVTISNWSLQFTASDLTTTTNALGNFVFADLPPGPLRVGVVYPGSPVHQDVTVGSSPPVSLEVASTPIAGQPGPHIHPLSPTPIDLGESVTGNQIQTLTAGQPDIYSWTAPLSGSLQLNVSEAGSVNGNLNVAVLTSDGLSTLSTSATGGSAVPSMQTVAVDSGETLLFVIAGSSAATSGGYQLFFANPDLYETAGTQKLFFPTAGSDPIGIATGELQNSPSALVSGAAGTGDLATINSGWTNPVSVLFNDGAGLFAAPQTLNGGAAASNTASGGPRSIALANFSGGVTPDIAFTNFSSADITVLNSLGSGAFSSDRRSDALRQPGELLPVVINGQESLIVLPSSGSGNVPPEVAILIGNGDGTFQPPIFLQTDLAPGTVYGVVGAFGAPNETDLALFSSGGTKFDIFRNIGAGVFAAPADFFSAQPVRSVVAADLTGRGLDDLLLGGSATTQVFVYLNASNADRMRFSRPLVFNATGRPGDDTGQVIGLAVADGGMVAADGSSQWGAGDNLMDLIAIVAPSAAGVPAEVDFLAQKDQFNGAFTGFAAADLLATGAFNGGIATGHFTGDGSLDVAVTGAGGVTVLYSVSPTIFPNNNFSSPRFFGTITHFITPPSAITPLFSEASFTFAVPTDSSGQAQVVDINANVTFGQSGGPTILISDQVGNSYYGPHVRLIEPQGQLITLFVANDPGAGAISFDIDVLPQIESVSADSLIPGATSTGASAPAQGPINTLAIWLRGDQLDPSLAGQSGTYTVLWQNASGIFEQLSDPITAVILNPAASTQVMIGRQFPDSVQQSVTLVFAQPLPAGSYQIELSSNLQTLPFSSDENSLFPPDSVFDGRPPVDVVATEGGMQAFSGGFIEADGLVPPPTGPADFSTFNSGTAFLTNLHDTLEALLNSTPGANTQALLALIDAEMGPTVAASPGTSFLVIVLDPVSFAVQDPQSNRTTSYSLRTTDANNGISRTYLNVGGNVEVMVLAGLIKSYTLTLSDVQPTSIGGAVLFSQGTVASSSLTEAIRQGQTVFEFSVLAAADKIGSGAQPTAIGQNQPAATPANPGGSLVGAGFLFGSEGATESIFGLSLASSVGGTNSIASLSQNNSLTYDVILLVGDYQADPTDDGDDSAQWRRPARAAGQELPLEERAPAHDPGGQSQPAPTAPRDPAPMSPQQVPRQPDGSPQALKNAAASQLPGERLVDPLLAAAVFAAGWQLQCQSTDRRTPVRRRPVGSTGFKA
jgi:hypothetical protein